LSGKTFVDTNVLVYVHDEDEPEKRERAQALLRELVDRIVLSPQVLSEFYVAVRRLETPVPAEVAAKLVDSYSRFPMVNLDPQLVRTAIAISRESGISYWDGLIMAAAQSAGCECLLSEDLSHGQSFGPVTVENPFREG
jgi:predicted nucleic acid-binding protein